MDFDFTAGQLFASLVVSTVGFALFTYGKKQVRFPQLITGVVMMIYPYFITGQVAMWSVAGALGLGLFAALRAGM